MIAAHNGTSQIGKSFNLRAIAADSSSEVWVCFARSKSNPEILRLAPACDARLTSSSVRIRSETGRSFWLIPGIEIAVHKLDLQDAYAGESFTICADDDADVAEALPAEESPVDELTRLSEVAFSIEAHFHEPAEPIVPSLDECQIDSIERDGPAARFSWKPDLSRVYCLTREGQQWLLRQTYSDPEAVPSDALVPFRTPSGLLSFAPASDGTATAPVSDAESLLKGLGLRYVADANELQRSSSAIVIPFAKPVKGRSFSPGAFGSAPSHPVDLEPTHAVFVRMAANEPEFRMRASFATGETPAAEARRTVRFDWGGDIVELIARPDPTGKRVQLEVEIAAPKWVRPGARLELAFPGMQQDPTGIVLTEAGGRLRGIASIATAWTVFSASEETSVEVLGAPAADA